MALGGPARGSMNAKKRRGWTVIRCGYKRRRNVSRGSGKIMNYSCGCRGCVFRSDEWRWKVNLLVARRKLGMLLTFLSCLCRVYTCRQDTHARAAVSILPKLPLKENSQEKMFSSVGQSE